MKMKICFAPNQYVENFPIPRQNIEYQQQISYFNGTQKDQFEVALSDGDKIARYYFPNEELPKVNTLAQAVKLLNDEINPVEALATYYKHDPPETVDDLIRTINGLDEMTFIPSIGIRELADHLIEHDYAYLPEKWLPYVNKELLAEQWLFENQTSAWIGKYGFIQDERGDEHKHAPIDSSTKEYDRFDHAFFNVTLEKDGREIDIELPCDDKKLELALKCIGSEILKPSDEADYTVSKVESRYADHAENFDYAHYTAHQLQRMAKALEPLTTDQFFKAMAVSEMHFCMIQDGKMVTKEQEITVLEEVAKSVDQYNVYTKSTRQSGMAEALFQTQEPALCANFGECFDYEKMCNDGVIDGKIVIAPAAYITYSNREIVEQTQSIVHDHYMHQLEMLEQNFNNDIGNMGGMSL